MSDSERPNPQTPNFEVPDLELEPAPRSLRQPGRPEVPVAPVAQAPATAVARSHDQLFGATFDFGDDLGDFELERTAQPNPPLGVATAPSATAANCALPSADISTSVPSGRAPDAAKLSFDPRELAILADYGDPPNNGALTLAYAYRVFTRQRELKHQLVPIAAECVRAETEREATLAELSRALRPAIEQIPEYRPHLRPILEIEQRAIARGQALNSINEQLGAHHAELDTELLRLKSQLDIEQHSASEAQRHHDEREANAKRAEAKLKRVQIEMRAVTQVAEQKLGPSGGQIPEPEAARLSQLEQRARAVQPEVTATRAALEQAKITLSQAHARLEALRHSERQINRKKQALGGAYHKELTARAEGVSEVEIEQRAALAELARAVLAAHGAIAIPQDWLERVRGVCDRADKLVVRTEMFRRAIVSYDAQRARQGVRLSCTAVGLVLVLLILKLIF